MVFGLCAAHNEEELLDRPHHATDKDISRTALGTAINTNVSMRKQKLMLKWKLK